jgi:hypothetical protein
MYRIRESELSIERPFAYTTDSTKYVVIKFRDDPPTAAPAAAWEELLNRPMPRNARSETR